MTTSALLRHGAGHAATLIAGLTQWSDARDFGSLAQMRGIMSQSKPADPQRCERANSIKIRKGYAHA